MSSCLSRVANNSSQTAALYSPSSSSRSGKKGGGDSNGEAEPKPQAVQACPEFPTLLAGADIECPMCAMITWHGFPKIIRAIRILGLGGLLRSETGSSEIVIQHSGSDLIAYDRLDGGHPDVEFAALVMRRPINRPGADLRLENRRHRLSFMPQATLDPAELRGI